MQDNCTKLEMICRICALECQNMKNIYDKINTIILEMLKKCTDNKFEEMEEEMPQQICDKCLSEVTLCYEFRLKTKKTDTMLRELFIDKKARNNDELSGNKGLNCEIRRTNRRILTKKKITDNRLKCEDCGKALSTYRAYLIHRTKHKIKHCDFCLICNKKILSTLSIHMQTHSGENAYKCHICGKAYNKSVSLLEHQNIHLGLKPFKCKSCEKDFVSKRQLIVHNRIHTKEMPYLCSICGRRFTHLSSYIGHNRTHSGEQPYKCPHCGKSCTTSSSLKLHIKRKNCSKIADVAQNSGSLCEICGQIYSSKITLQNHMAKHTSQMMFKCHMCDKGFTREDHLKSHLRIHTGERPFVCTFCGKGFTQSSVLKTHLALHNGKQHTCNICSRSFSRPSHLKRHMEIHSGTRQFQCSQCDKKFVQKSHLNVHEKSHRGDKPYKCLTCNTSFSQNITLRNHILTHTGERPYLCDFCGISYTQAGRLANHKKQVHGDQDHVMSTDTTEMLSASSINSLIIEDDIILENLPSSQSIRDVGGQFFENQTLELVTQDGQTFLATFYNPVT